METHRFYVYGCQEEIKKIIDQQAGKFFCLRPSRSSESKGKALETYLRRASGFEKFKERIIAAPLEFDLGLHMQYFSKGYAAQNNPVLATGWVMEELRDTYRQMVARNPGLAQTLTALGQTSVSPHRIFHALTRDVRAVLDIFDKELKAEDFTPRLSKTYKTANFGGNGDAVTTFVEVAPCMMVADNFCSHISPSLRLCVDTSTPKKMKAWIDRVGEDFDITRVADFGENQTTFTNILNRALVLMNAQSRKRQQP